MGIFSVGKLHQPACPVLKLVSLTKSERSVPVSVEQLIIIKFLVCENVKPTEIYRRLHAQFGEATLLWSSVQAWSGE